jgi:hypothetical protein
VREFRSRGSVRGAVGNDRPYRDRRPHVIRRSIVRKLISPGSGPLGWVRKTLSLKWQTRCGTKPCAFQMRCTEHTPMPAASVVAVSVQWVASWGGSVAVRATR